MRTFKSISIFLCLFITNTGFAQTFLNGSFEVTTGNCDWNLTNSEFNSMMSDCYAFGSIGSIDIIKDTCGYGGAQDGGYFIALDVSLDSLTNALSLALTTPLSLSDTFEITFYNKKSPINANVLEIGYSTDSLSFGTLIDTVSIPDTSWNLVTKTFVASSNSKFITVRTIAGSYGWNWIDNFSITNITTGIIEQNKKNLHINVYPNPNPGAFTLQMLFEAVKPETSVHLYNILGELIYSNVNIKKHYLNIDISQNPGGIYFVKVISGSEVFVGKIIYQ